MNTGGQNHQLTTTFPATIMASAETSIYNDAAASGQAGCELGISDGSGPTSGMTQMADFQYFNFPAVLHYNNAFNVTGGAEKPAGTYNIALRCSHRRRSHIHRDPGTHKRLGRTALSGCPGPAAERLRMPGGKLGAARSRP